MIKELKTLKQLKKICSNLDLQNKNDRITQTSDNQTVTKKFK